MLTPAIYWQLRCLVIASSMLIGLLSCGLSPTWGQSASKVPLVLRVLSYNIHHGEGVDGKLDLERIARVISSVQPDIVALQEVDLLVARSQSIDQPRELARLTGMHSVFGANIDLQGGKYGNAVLARESISQSHNHLLPNIQQGE